MADQDRTGELSINTYFDEGLADGTEPNNPFEVLEPEEPKKKKKVVSKRNHPGRKRVLVVLCIILVLILAAVIFFFIQHRIDHRPGLCVAGKLPAGRAFPDHTLIRIIA